MLHFGWKRLRRHTYKCIEEMERFTQNQQKLVALFSSGKENQEAEMKQEGELFTK